MLASDSPKMHSYSSAVDGKTLVRVGGGHNARSFPRSSGSTLHPVRSDLGISSGRTSVTSTQTPITSLPTHVTITSSGINNNNDDISSVDDRRSNSSVTVKSVAAGKKMTSLIDTKSGHVTSSVIAQATNRMSRSNSVPSSSPSSPVSILSLSPPSLITYGPESISGFDLSLNPKAAPKATSVLLTSTGLAPDSFDIEPGKTLVSAKSTSSLRITSNPDQMIQSTDRLSSPTKNPSSVVFTSNPDSLPAEIRMTSSRHSTVSVVSAEVHPEPKFPYLADLDPSWTKGQDAAGQSLVGLPVLDDFSVVEEDTNSYFTKDLPRDQSDAGSLIFSDELETHSTFTSEDKEPVADNVTGILAPIATKKKPSALASTSLPSAIPSIGLTTVSAGSTSSGVSCMTGSVSVDSSSETGSGSGLDPESETKRASTFHFVCWDANDPAERMDSKCHRVLIYKDTEIVLMFKTSCASESAGCDPRLNDLMVDIAINCAERLTKMKDITQQNLQAEHIDTLPLSDSRSTKDHLQEISRQLNAKVSINDVAYRFQSKDDDVFIGTHVDGKDVAVRKKNCEIGVSGTVVVLRKKSRFATVESFSEQLCRHIITNRPRTLGRISDDELRRLNLRTETPKSSSSGSSTGQDQLLLQKFLSDASIVVAEAARRSFLRIEDFLLF